MKKDDAVVIPKESEDGASTSKEVTKSKKEDVNIVFMGHANTGKRTIIGEIMVLTDIVDRGALEKYKQKAKRESKQGLNFFLIFFFYQTYCSSL